VLDRSQVGLTRGGVTDLFLKTQAECQVIDPDAGAKLQTRRPTNALFTQFYGLSLCTLANGTAIAEAGYGIVRAATAAGTPLASLRASLLTRFRTLLDPGAVLAVAVIEGRLIVVLTNGRKIAVSRGNELQLLLDGPADISDFTTRKAQFTPTELKTLRLQGRFIKP
jgi:hypothetical protein